MKDERLQNALAKTMIIGTAIAGTIIALGMLWFLWANAGMKAGDKIFTGEPKYYENPISMVQHAMALNELGHRRSFIMVGVLLLLLNPVARVALAALGFALQKDRMYTIISLIVLSVLLISFFW